MHIPKRSRLEKNITIIQPGEFHASADDDMIGTLLGSCVSVCLHDPVRHVSGMNHFMLPGRIVKADLFMDRSARYGISAINDLLALMEKTGASRKDMIAKVFGGGRTILNSLESNTIPFDNIRLARVMLEIEDIPIVEMEVGGSSARKILMDVTTGKVFLKNIISGKIIETIDDDEFSYIRKCSAKV
jgi:chemotaxis receptor (MCP) glutamine deamidase CheD